MQFYLCIITLNILVYWRTVFYGLVIDDIEWYAHWDDQWRRTDVGRGYSGSRWWFLHPHTILNSLYGAATFYSFNRRWRSYRIDHMLTLSLHIITALLLSHISFVAALLWSIHPCNHQTSIWLTGRRYSIINILFLTMLITHTIWLLIPLTIFVGIHYSTAIRARIRKSVPLGEYNPTSILRCLWFSAIKLSGVIRYSFRYPYYNTAPYLPCTQPVAERYLSIPLIIWCLTISTIPFICVILPLYAFRTMQLMPMYYSIQNFYNYHRRLYPHLEKLVLIKNLYPSIKDYNFLMIN